MKKNYVFLIIVLVFVGNLFCYTITQKGDIESTINTALRVQYGWRNINALKEICTKEFVETINLDELYLGRKIYSVDKEYVENIQEINEDKVVVSVNVYSPDITIHKFTLIRMEDNKYLISKIELDI